MAIDKYSPRTPEARKQQVRAGMTIAKYSAIGFPAALVLLVLGIGSLAAVVLVATIGSLGYGAWKVRTAVND
ncbi:MAG: hypothetical protein L0H59_09575 [Tomitella sp.]|nr:hypothetical protein [Tomitella sp.]